MAEESKKEYSTYEENTAILHLWSTSNTKIIKLSQELEKHRREKKELEEKYPFLTNVKGMLRKDRKGKESTNEAPDEMVDIGESPKKAKSPEGTPKKKQKTTRERLEKSMENIKVSNQEVVAKTGVSRDTETSGGKVLF